MHRGDSDCHAGTTRPVTRAKRSADDAAPARASRSVPLWIAALSDVGHSRPASLRGDTTRRLASSGNCRGRGSGHGGGRADHTKGHKADGGADRPAMRAVRWCVCAVALALTPLRRGGHAGLARFVRRQNGESGEEGGRTLHPNAQRGTHSDASAEHITADHASRAAFHHMVTPVSSHAAQSARTSTGTKSASGCRACRNPPTHDRECAFRCSTGAPLECQSCRQARRHAQMSSDLESQTRRRRPIASRSIRSSEHTLKLHSAVCHECELKRLLPAWFRSRSGAGSARGRRLASAATRRPTPPTARRRRRRGGCGVGR